MDKFLIEKYTDEMTSRTLRLDSYLIKKFGIRKQNIFLKIRDYYLHCIPFELSFGGCKILVVLKPKEMTFFKQFFHEKHTIHLKFYSDSQERDLGFYIWSTITESRLIDTAGNIWMMNISYQAVPNDYRELLIAHFLKEDKNRKTWLEHKENNKHLSRKTLKISGFDDHVNIFNDQGLYFQNCDLLSLSMSSAKVLIDICPDDLDKSNLSLQMELKKKNQSIFSDITLCEYREFENISDILSVDFELSYTPLLIEELSSCY